MKLTVALLAAAIASTGTTLAASNMMINHSKTTTVQMKAEHNSGENGTATLTQTDKGVVIVVNIKGAPKNADQPTHIHPGTCTHLNPAPEYPLSPLSNGVSKTTLPGKKLSDLMGGKFSINVHKSSNDLATYVSCGEIR